ncbi:BglG family transcription antiterminator LicT [Lysinibacillus sp. G4S2]|uniref:BglG family transcription antiterminator LicT n=1 Tax=Lysinibacillus sp. G4S2 TaxID=3055859 RepID=UPI0025A205DC|nr:PRD domain-containing protein [Lysinibacillus sp. G4S2]MDM5249789.1 PRD domain-containing protein [Lysinibacillus sp. G4S2]
MNIKKILNNNVVVTTTKLNQEIVVMGKGLAFQKKIGETIDASKIEKTFVLENHEISEKLSILLKDTSELYVNISSKIFDYAQSELSSKLDEYLYVALTDHLSFAISRHKQGIYLKNVLLWEIRKYYKQEFQIALKSLDIIESDTGIRLGEDEAASIALHLVNSQLFSEDMAAAVRVTEIVNNILNIVKYHFRMELDESSINHDRFLTHLRFTAIRFIRKEKEKEKEVKRNDPFLYKQVKKKYSTAFHCSQKIMVYLENTYGWVISNEEITYLTLHIHRIINRYTN